MPTWSIRLPLGIGRKLGWTPEPLPWTRVDHACFAVVTAAAWVLWASLAACASDRIQTLRTVENYALAVYDQLVWNFAFTGAWRQTIHIGYDDTWNWSGHLALWIFPITAIYRYFPGPTTLVWAQTGAIALGAFPVYFLARRAFGARPAAAVASLAYLCWPAMWAVALADYQDIVLGVPFLIAAYAASQGGRAFAAAVLALLTCGAREEWLFIVPFIPLAAPGGLREKARQSVVLGAMLLPYLLFLVKVRLEATSHQQHDTPLVQQLAGLWRWPPPFTRSFIDLRWFYTHFTEPFTWLGVLSPITLLPTGLAWFMHACSPPQGGVDATFAGHIHHMAPVVGLLSVGGVLGGGRAWRWTVGLWRGGWAHKLAGLLLAGAVLSGVRWAALDTRRVLGWVRVQPHLLPHGDARPADEWRLLAENVPANATIATDVTGSLLVSTRSTSYTYDESLADKAPRRSLSAVDYLLVRKTDTDWVERVNGWPGATRIGETQKYELWRMQ